MVTVILLGIFAMFFACLEDTGTYKHGLKISFGLIFLFLALRYYYGNDYPAYLNLFREVGSTSDFDFFDESFLQVEGGWILLCWLCKPIGFFAMIIILAFFNCWVYYRFFKKYVPVKYYWLAMLMYVFGTEYMLIGSTAMRQNIAILLFLLSLDYLYNNKIIKYSACIILASIFHTSALILLSLIFIRLVNIKIRLTSGLLIMSSYILLFVLGKDLLPFINNFVSSYFGRYLIYQGDSAELGSGIGLLLTSFLLSVVLYYSIFQNKENSFIIKIGIISFFFIPLSMLIMLSTRVGMYFQPALLAVYPVTLANIKNTLFRTVIIAIILLLAIYNFVIFFQTPIFAKWFGTYQTILSAPDWS